MLIATSVAEEGMDIPAANCVVRFNVGSNPCVIGSKKRLCAPGGQHICRDEGELFAIC